MAPSPFTGIIRAAVGGPPTAHKKAPDHGSAGLMPLNKLRTYVQREKHLPNVPSAAEVERDGIDLGGFSMRLLEKTEELTLYTLDQDRRLNEKDAEIEMLRKKNAELGARLARIEAMLAPSNGGAR